ncbi:MAG TPA: ABC transporter permease [Vicinamibacterales bacterium]|nr:ABC transporter permease [Vicinamibacterales bacterium]
MISIFRRLRYFFGRSRHDADLRAEIEAHRALRQEAFERDGVAPEDAVHASRRALGNVALAVDDARDVWTIRTVDSILQDMRAALRGLRKSPGFALVAIGTLALGIGANTALFSIFSSLILRPLPVRDPGSLALLTNGSWSYPIWEEIRAREAELFDDAFAWSPQTFDLSAGGQSDPVDGAYVSGRLFDVLGVTAIRGRMITPADDGGAAPSFGAAQDAPSASRGADGPVAVISHRLWRQRFAGANDVVGRRLTVQRISFTIVGVMPQGFFGPDVGRMTDVMLPFGAEPLIRGRESRLASAGSSWLQIMVRLKPGQSLEQANAALRTVQPQIVETATISGQRSEPLTLVLAATGNSSLRRRFETPLFAMVVAVGLVLLVACANIASLLLARTLARRRELSVRLALGSSRWRIARLLFVESVIVAATGAAFALVFAKWSSALLVQQLSTWQSTVSLDLALDWRVLAFTAALACLSAVTAGVAPVLGLKRITPGDAIKDMGRGIAGDRRFAMRGALVVAQIAVSLVLVVAAGLFLRTFASLNQLPLGFVAEPLLVAELNLQASGRPPEERSARVERLRDAAAAVPGVRSASVSAIRLLTGGGWASGLVGVGDGPISPSRPFLWRNATTPGWFETMGMSLRSGRDFEAADRVGSSPVAIVNEAFVRRYLRGEQPIGQHVRLGRDADTRYEIVGVVGDAVYTTPREGMLATMYVPVAQQAPESFWPTVLLTINAAPGQRAAVERDVAAALTQTDPTVAFTLGTFDQLVEATVTQERLIAMLSAFFGGLALLLAAVGLYGVVAHAVRARQTEIGLRMALGAAPSSIVRLVFQRVSVLIAAGVAFGLAGSLWAARFVEALLFHLEPRDPVTFAGAAAVLVAVGVLAAWMPARRAARLDPVAVLREG